MNRKHLPFWKRMLFHMIGIASMLLVVSLLGEAGVRAFVFFRNKNYPTLTTTADRELGSRVRESFHWQGVVTDAAGETYPLLLSTDERGFRHFGDTSTTKKKVLFAGDSFTQAIEVSDDRTYFSLLAGGLDFEAFAYGCRGYSTLQEWMIVEKYLPVIRPDVVVLQFCSNDFINNHFELERHSLLNNNRRRRPYLSPENEVFYGVPARWGWNWLDERTMFFELIFTRMERIFDRSVLPENQSEFRIEREGMAYAPFAESIEVTKRLLTKFRDELPPGTKLLVFTVDNYQPFYDTICEICYEENIPFAGYIPQRLDSLTRQGHTSHSLDGAHWNELGHAVAADVLACELRDVFEGGGVVK